MSEWPPAEFELCKGPQDGAKVKRIGDVMPQVIFVGPKWLGDGYAAWGSERCKRFPCRYVMDAFHFNFKECSQEPAEKEGSDLPGTRLPPREP